MVGFRTALLGLFLLAAFDRPAALGQVPTNLPTPSVVGREVQPVDPPHAPNRPQINVPDKAPALSVPAALAGREVLFRRVVVEGTTAFSAADLDPIFAPILNRRVPFAEIVAAVNRIAALYQDAGYVFYNVVLPTQDFAGDRLRIVVIEGTISRIVVGDGIRSEAVRQRIVDVLSPLVGHRPLRRAELERRVLNAADTPGVTLKVGAAADSAGGTGALQLVVDGTFDRFSPIAQLDSFQTTPDTTVNFRVGGIGRSLLIGGDQLEARYIFAVPWDRLHFGDLRYGLPIGTDGGRLNLIGQAVWQRPPTTFNGQPASLLGRSILARAQYSHPIIRQQKLGLVGFGVLDVIEVDYTLQGLHIPGDSLRVLRAGLAGNYTDGLDGQWIASVQASFGLDVIDARTGGRASATPGFVKFNLALQRRQPIGRTVTAIVRGSAQVATGSLPASEVFGFGGREFGRGFVVSDAVGDHAVAASAELRYAPDWLESLKSTFDPYLYTFIDYGRLWAIDPLNAPFFSQGVSTGLGLHARLFEQYSGEVEVAKILVGRTSSSATTHPWRFAFRVGSSF
jgi:hemolysin activation/secretion protein